MAGSLNGQVGKVSAIIVAAGEPQGKGSFDRIFADLAGRPVLAYSIAAFESCPAVGEIILVINQSNLARSWNLAQEQGWSKLTKIVPGGARRQDSVVAGLQELSNSAWVFIHDGSRPLVTAQMIQQCLACAQGCGAAILAVPVRDAVKMVNAEQIVRGTPDRSTLWLAQTPQCFRTDLIVQGYRDAFGDVSDDSVLIERQNQPVKVCPGSYQNIKINGPDDLQYVEFVLRRTMAQAAT